MALWNVSLPLGAYGISYWLPAIVKGFGVTNTVNGLINIISWALVALALWGLPKIAARSGQVGIFITGPALFGAVCLVLSVYVPGSALKFAFICFAAAGIFAARPIFWSVPSSFLSGAAAALAAINSIGNLGGFVAQNVVPLIKDQTGSNELPMLFVAACVFLGSVLTFALLAYLARHRAPLTT